MEMIQNILATGLNAEFLERLDLDPDFSGAVDASNVSHLQ